MGLLLQLQHNCNAQYYVDSFLDCLGDGCVKMILKIVQRIFQFISIVMFFIVVYMLLLKITGHSPTVEDVLLAGMTIHIAAFIAFIVQSCLFQGRVSEFISHSKQFMSATITEIRNVRNEIATMNNRLTKIEQKIKV